MNATRRIGKGLDTSAIDRDVLTAALGMKKSLHGVPSAVRNTYYDWFREEIRTRPMGRYPDVALAMGLDGAPAHHVFAPMYAVRSHIWQIVYASTLPTLEEIQHRETEAQAHLDHWQLRIAHDCTPSVIEATREAALGHRAELRMLSAVLDSLRLKVA